jgi:osmotically-inducible protein OsmY
MVPETRTDAELQQDVLEEIDWDPEVEATEIGVTVDAGVVTLTGLAPSPAASFAAGQAALRVAGVRAVANDVVFGVPETRTDTEIAKAVADALDANRSLPRGQVQATVKNGLVTLTGTVPFGCQRASAGASVSRVAGVRGAANLIAVREPAAPAGEVRSGIARALRRGAAADAAGFGALPAAEAGAGRGRRADPGRDAGDRRGRCSAALSG